MISVYNFLIQPWYLLLSVVIPCSHTWVSPIKSPASDVASGHPRHDRNIWDAMDELKNKELSKNKNKKERKREERKKGG